MRKGLIILIMLVIITGCTQRAVRYSADNVNKRAEETKYNYLLAEAFRHKYAGNISDAARVFEKCIEEDKNRSVPYYELAQIYSVMGQDSKSMEYASRAARMEPGNYWYQLACGSLFTQYGEKDSALVYFNRALNADKNAREVNSILAGLYAEKGEAQKADSLFRLLDREGGLSEDMFLMMISGLINNKNFNEAAKRTEKLISEQPSEIKYMALLADIYYESGQREKSDSIYRAIIEKDPENIENQLLYLMNQVYRREYKGITGFLNSVFESDLIERERKLALAGRLVQDTAYVKENSYELEKSLLMLENKYPRDEQALSVRPGMYEIAGRKEEAIKRYEELLQTVETGFYISEQLILLYSETREYEKLFSLASKYSAANNKSLIGKVYYAIAAMELKKYDVAEAELQKAMILAGNNDELKVQVLAMMGDLKYRMKDFEGAYGYYEEALEISPDNILVLNNYAYFLAEGNKELRKALKMIEAVMKKEGDNDTYIDTYAWVLYKLGRTKKAHEMMMKIFGKDGEKDPDILEHMGYILKKMGKCNEAVIYWKNALTKDKSRTYLEKEMEECTGN